VCEFKWTKGGGKRGGKGKAVRASALGRVFFVSREKSKAVPIARVGEELL
jgi:hypothetical protein